MKTKGLTICFLSIVFVLAALNVGNAILALDPFVTKFVRHESVQDVHSAKELIQSVDASYNDNFKTKMAFVELHGLTRKLIGSRQYNSVLRLNNGYLTYQYGDADVELYAENITQLDQYVKSKGKEFLYVAVPFKICPLDQEEQLPAGVTDDSNANQDEMLSILQENDVAFYDLRNVMAQEIDDWYAAFFKTDQHWKPETAFWAYGKMAELFHDRYGYEIDDLSTDLSNYNVEHMEDWFLGSQGKKTGIVYAGVDDFDLIYPRFETEMTVDIPVHDEHRTGTFRDVMFKDSNLEKDYYNINNYAAYTGGDYPLCIQKNDSAVNDKKILVLKDSFTVAFQPYLSFLFKEVHVIDLRHYDGSVEEYIDEVDPDLVMVFYTSSMMSYPEAYVFDR